MKRAGGQTSRLPLGFKVRLNEEAANPPPQGLRRTCRLAGYGGADVVLCFNMLHVLFPPATNGRTQGLPISVVNVLRPVPDFSAELLTLKENGIDQSGSKH